MRSQVEGLFVWSALHVLVLLLGAKSDLVDGFAFKSFISSKSSPYFSTNDGRSHSDRNANRNTFTSSKFMSAIGYQSQQPEPTPAPAIPCDFETYEATGCEDEEGSYCDTDSQKCTCKDGFPVRLLTYCLPKKSIGEECYTSSQCNSVSNAACFIFGKEYDNERISGGHNVGRQLSNWPTGTCRCNIGYQLLDASSPTLNAVNGSKSGQELDTGIYLPGSISSSMECIKKTVGSWCTDDWDCIKETFNTQCARPQNLCECSWGFYYDDKTDTCAIPKLFGTKCIGDSECSAEKLVCSPSTNRCVCPKGFHFDVIKPGCKPNDDSSCDYGYKWDEEWGRCIPARSTAAAFPFNQINSRNKVTTAHGSDTVPGSPTTSTTTTQVKNESGSSTLTTILLLVVPNVIGFAVFIHYYYLRKREDDDDTSDLERTGQLRSLRPTHNFFCSYPYHRNGANGVATNGVASCCGGDKVLTNLVTGHPLHHYHLPPTSTLVTHNTDGEEVVDQEPNGQTSVQINGDASTLASCAAVPVTAVISVTNSGTSVAVIESHLENGHSGSLELQSEDKGEEDKKEITEKEVMKEITQREEKKEEKENEKKKVPEPSSSTNMSSGSISATNDSKEEQVTRKESRTPEHLPSLDEVNNLSDLIDPAIRS